MREFSILNSFGEDAENFNLILYCLPLEVLLELFIRKCYDQHNRPSALAESSLTWKISKMAKF